MEQNILTFNDPVFGDVRTLLKDGVAWFVGKDVATALGYAKPENAIATHVEEEDKTSTLIQGSGSNYKSKALIINESGVYSLIFSSKLPQAKAFKRWVTSVVLPQIRKTGGYIPVGQNDEEKDILARAVKILNRTVEQQQDLIEAQRPLVEFAAAVTESEGCIEIAEMAKILCQNGYDTGRARFYTWLRAHGYIFQHKTMPIQKWVEKGIFETKERVFVTSSGKKLTSTTPMVTGKGQKYFVDMLCFNRIPMPAGRKGKVSLYN